MGQAPAGSDCNRDGIGTPFVKVGEFGEERPIVREWTTDPKKLARTTDVLICVVGATCGKINLGADCAIGRSVAAIRPKTDKVEQRYLWYFMQGKVQEMRQGSQGAAQTVINREMINDLLIPLPPLDEQRRIVAVLDKAFAGIATATANAKKNLTNARVLFERGLSDSFQNSGATVSLGSIAKFVRGPFGGSLKKSIFQPSGFAIYEQQHAIYDQFSEVRYFVSTEKFEEMARFQIHPGDILMSCSGTIGRVALVPDGAKPGIINQALLKLSPSKKVMGEYLLWYMRSQMFREQIAARSGGAALQNVASVAVLKEITFPLPGSINQLKIVSNIQNLKASIDNLAGVMSSKLAALAELKQSLLQKAFAGKLT